MKEQRKDAGKIYLRSPTSVHWEKKKEKMGEKAKSENREKTLNGKKGMNTKNKTAC